MDGRPRRSYEPARVGQTGPLPKATPLDKFSLHPALVATSEALGDLKLCHARLQSDARWPWIVLVPRIVGARELEHLSPQNRQQLTEEIVLAGGAVRAIGAALGRPVEKLNVGQLGNITPQLHIHIVGRRADDPAWPGPVWGVGEPIPYAANALATAADAAHGLLSLLKSA